jgi:hypothetical protein
MKEAETIYSNIVNLRMTPNELVLEFGTHFQEKPNKPGEAVNFTPTVRVIMSANAVDSLHATLAQAIKQRNELIAATQNARKAQ